MFKAKVSDMVNSIDSIKALLEMDVAGETAFLVGRILKVAGAESENYFTVRNKKVLEYGAEFDVPVSEGVMQSQFRVKDENIQKFQDEMKALEDSEIEIQCSKIKLEKLTHYDGKEVLRKPKLFMQLDWMIEQ